MRLSLPALALISLAATGAAYATNLDRGRAKMMAMTIDDFRSKITTADDDLETVAVISTAKSYRTKSSDFTRSDSFIHAGIDKKTGQTVYQVKAGIVYFGGWRFYNTVNFSTLADPVSLPTRSVRDVDCGSGICAYNEGAAFEVSEELLRSIGKMTAPWRIRFSCSAGEDWNEEMNPGEIAALLGAVSAYKAAHSLR